MIEFTGERVIPGEVDPDLYNEHLARYIFAARLARGRRILDAGCGVGYGAARLAAGARQVIGLEIAPEAVAAARREYAAPGLQFVRGDCCSLPFASGSFDLVVAFEVIEHLERREELLGESRRVLAPEGLLVVSTPNRLFYAESRDTPNPFHVHEFDYEEFRAALERHFRHVAVLFENHVPALAFSRACSGAAATAVQDAPAEPDAAHFFIALCSSQPLDETVTQAFVYVPESGNVLRERQKHITLLTGWLEDAKGSLATLHAEHQALEKEAAAERAQAQGTIDQLEAENEKKTAWARQLEADLAQLRAEYDERTAWALKLEGERADLQAAYQRLDVEANQVRLDLKAVVDQLHATEVELEKRTEWARGLDEQVRRLTADLHSIFGSIGYRAGKRLGMIPPVASDPRSGA